VSLWLILIRMPTFRFTSLPGPSGPDAGVIDAPDRAAALRILIQRGQTPSRLEETTTNGTHIPGATGRAPSSAETSVPVSSTPSNLLRALRALRGESRAGIVHLMRELATAVGAGLPLVPALRTIARQSHGERRIMLDRLIDQVEHGRALSEAMESIGRPFNDLIISLVRAGEAGGRLPEVLAQAARLLERDRKVRSAVLGSLLYPAIIFGAVTIAVIVVVTVIVPRVLAAVSGQIRVLPLPTRIVQGLAHAIGEWWWLIILLAFGLLWGGARLYAKSHIHLVVDGWLLRIPVLGMVLRDIAVARFTRTFGTLITAGLPVLNSLRITRDTLGNRALESAMDRVCDAVAAGRTIAEPLERTGLFPPLIVQIVSLGEQTGRLDEVLNQAADAFEERVEQSLKVFTTVLPPILIVLMAGVVAMVVLSILLPLIELQESIG